MNKQGGMSHILIPLLVIVVSLVAYGGYRVYTGSRESKGANKDLAIEARPEIDKILEYEVGTRLQPSTFGVKAGLPVADVSAIKLEDGSWRIYAFAQEQGIVSAISDDGLNYVAESGVRMDGGAGMPRVFRLDDGRYRMYYIEKNGIGSSTSTDGIIFTREEGLRIVPPEGVNETSGISTPVKLSDGKWYVYFSDLPRPGDGIKHHKIYVATSDDLYNWDVSDDPVIGGSESSSSAEHPDVIVDREGKLYIFYFVNGSQKLVYSMSGDGIMFSDAKETGLDCNDPNIVRIDGNSYRIYCGKFEKSIGGYVKSAVLQSIADIQ